MNSLNEATLMCESNGEKVVSICGLPETVSSVFISVSVTIRVKILNGDSNKPL